jgi:hypothetical protein
MLNIKLRKTEKKMPTMKVVKQMIISRSMIDFDLKIASFI